MCVYRNEEERNSWVDMLQRAIDDQTHRRNTFENGKTGGQVNREITLQGILVITMEIFFLLIKIAAGAADKIFF